VTPLGVAAEYGHTEALDILIQHGITLKPFGIPCIYPSSMHTISSLKELCCVFSPPPGGDVSAQASNGDTVLYDASGSGNLDCIKLLLLHGANPNVASYACQLPIHRAAYEGHIL